MINKIIQVDPSKESLRFLVSRVYSDNYRGMQVSQHNRYDMEVICHVLQELYDLVGDEFLRIRTTDLKKRPQNTPEECLYANYTHNVNTKINRCTQDSLRKNLFVDLHRMGFLERYSTNYEKLLPYEKRKVVYVKISEMGKRFIKSQNIFEKNLNYTKGIDALTNSLAADILDTIIELSGISMFEFQLFLSFVNCELNGTVYSKSILKSYIEEFRMMGRFQREFVIDTIKEYCVPSRFAGNKKDKRDFHNWQNETQQIFMLLSQTIYYEVINDKIIARIGADSLFEDATKLKRSLSEKQEYFKQHKVNKKYGFELHHIVPLFWANNRNEYFMLDSWQNMIYIDAFSHAKMTQQRSIFAKLDIHEDYNIELLSVRLKSLILEYGKNVEYGYLLADTMLSANEELLTVLS